MSALNIRLIRSEIFQEKPCLLKRQSRIPSAPVQFPRLLSTALIGLCFNPNSIHAVGLSPSLIEGEGLFNNPATWLAAGIGLSLLTSARRDRFGWIKQRLFYAKMHWTYIVGGRFVPPERMNLDWMQNGPDIEPSWLSCRKDPLAIVMRGYMTRNKIVHLTDLAKNSCNLSYPSLSQAFEALVRSDGLRATEELIGLNIPDEEKIAPLTDIAKNSYMVGDNGCFPSPEASRAVKGLIGLNVSDGKKIQPLTDIVKNGHELGLEALEGLIGLNIPDSEATVREAGFNRLSSTFTAQSLDALVASSGYTDIHWLIAEHKECSIPSLIKLLNSLVKRNRKIVLSQEFLAPHTERRGDLYYPSGDPIIDTPETPPDDYYPDGEPIVDIPEISIYIFWENEIQRAADIISKLTPQAQDAVIAGLEKELRSKIIKQMGPQI